MPRIAIAGLAYHVTHRGNRRGPVFFAAEDRETYLRWLADCGARYGLEIWAYCLMTNHVHLLVRTEQHDALARVMRDLQGYYARRINERQQWSGHLWANRFYSQPVEGGHLWAAARYIERNPVRARIVQTAAAYPLSSARAHCGLAREDVLSPHRPFANLIGWSVWLESDDPETEARIRQLIRTGHPLGGDAFCRRIGRALGRPVSPPARGRPKRMPAPSDQQPPTRESESEASTQD
jgi:putative transposase